MYNAGIADGIWIPSATEVEAWERVEFCAENGRDELLRQWDTEKNGGKNAGRRFLRQLCDGMVALR